jgi:hypothetical protein
MSIAEFLPSPAPTVFAADRRNAARHRFTEIVPLSIGRTEGTFVDLSATGLRVRHASAVPVGVHTRIRYAWRRRTFEGTAEVLASRFVGASEAFGTRYETRFRFLPLSPEAQVVLDQTILDLEENDMRKWVANLRGWHDEPTPQEVVRSAGRRAETFVVSRCVSGRWEQKVTRSNHAPVDGFTVPAGIHPRDLLMLRRTYMLSEDGKDMVRLMSRAVVQEQTT